MPKKDETRTIEEVREAARLAQQRYRQRLKEKKATSPTIAERQAKASRRLKSLMETEKKKEG